MGSENEEEVIMINTSGYVTGAEGKVQVKIDNMFKNLHSNSFGYICYSFGNHLNLIGLNYFVDPLLLST